MKSLSAAIVASSVAVLLICAVLTRAAPLFSPQPGIVLLKNGQVIAGSILREGDRYVVTLGERGDKGELKIPLTEVDAVCRNLDEAYEHKRDSILQSGVKPHTDLAEWCIRHGMLDRAADELVVAMRIDPSDAKIAAVERRLKFAAEPKTQKKPRPAPVLPPSQAEIEAVLRTLPSETIEEFTANVQPLLLNRCATTACHGPNSDADFHLIRPPLRHANKTRETQRNLFASLSQIAPQGESHLLTMALAPHGGMESPVLDHHDRRQVEQLAAWIERVKNSSPAEAKVEKEDRNVRRVNFEEEEMPSTTRRLPGVEPPAEFEPEKNAKPLKQQPNAFQKKGAGARDPFDPQIFNEKYHSQP
jgi:hypothetical protein